MARTGIGEDALHAIFQSSFRRRKGLSGPGDDCAELRPPAGKLLQLSCDQLVEGVHVEIGTEPKVQARKLLRRTLSDLAAAGAKPWAVSWTIAAPSDRGHSWLKKLARAFLAEAEAFDVAVIGGDLSTSGPPDTHPAGLGVVLACTAIGLSDKPAPGRSGAKPGDWLLVTGALGGAVQSGRHLLPEPRLTEGQRLLERYSPHAMMDISDGLAQDLPRVLEASQVAADVDLAALPLHSPLTACRADWKSAVAEGEDYELLVAMAPRTAQKAMHDPVLKKVGLRHIGIFRTGSGLNWLADGRKIRLAAKGWQHNWTSAENSKS